MGAGVVIARYYGARKAQEGEKAVHTLVAFGLVAGVVLTVVGMSATPYILRWMGTPETVLSNSVLYFRIYFLKQTGFTILTDKRYERSRATIEGKRRKCRLELY